MTQTEALRLALEALSPDPYRSEWAVEEDKCKAITAIKAALEAKDEPWEKFCDSHCVWTDHHPDCKLAKDEPVAQPEVRTGNCLRVGVCASEGHKIQPQRKPLTDEEIEAIAKEHVAVGTRSFQEFARRIEAAHGIKGEA